MKWLKNLFNSKVVTATILFMLAVFVFLPQSAMATRYINYQSKTFVYPKINNMYVDHCLYWGKQCGQPAANEFCRIKGYEKAIEHQWRYKKPTRTLGSGQVCNINRGCGAISRVQCVKKGTASSPPSPGSGKIAVRIERKAHNCKQAGKLGSKYVRCRVSYSLENTTNKPIYWSSGKHQTAYGPTAKIDRRGFSYRYAAIQPGKKEIKTYDCVIPKGHGHGVYSASGSGRHYGDANKHSIRWRISMKCP